MKTKTTLPITEARKKIFGLAEEVQKAGVCYTLTERGKPKAVLLSARSYETLIGRKTGGSWLADGCAEKYAFQSPQIFSKTLIIRDESRVVYLSGDDRSSKYQEESLIKAQLYVKLIEEYKYPIHLVEFGRHVKVGPTEGKHYIEADVIINDENGNVRMIFETCSFDDFEENADRIVADLFSLASALSWVKKPEHLVYFSRNGKNVHQKEKIMVIDCTKFNTFAAWKKAGRPAGKEIPSFAF